MAVSTATLVEQAWGFLTKERPAEALKAANAVLAHEPGNISALACRAMARWSAEGENPDSLEEMRRAVDAAPKVPALRHNYGLLLAWAGRVDDAATQYRTALALDPHDTQAFWGLVSNSRIRESDGLVGDMEALYADAALPPLRRQFLAFALAKAFDDLGAPDKAMRFAGEGNRLQGGAWDVGHAEARLAELRRLAEAGALADVRTSKHPSRAPLFIVGMPRSGTTLIETILSRHPDVLALGETRLVGSRFEAAERKFAAPGRIDVGAALTRDWLKAQAEEVARSWSARRGGFAVVTDKMPDNAFALGFIRQLFPNARVIYARRHPLDAGVSNFMMRFGDGQHFSTRLDWIGKRSRHVAETMEIWKSALDLPILDVRYEQLVTDPEGEIRRMAAFAGLSWTGDFLTPERSERAARTASEWQVRQPINRRSVARWRRYEPWLGPMIEAMGGMEWIETQVSGAPAGVT